MQRDEFFKRVQAATKLPPAGRADALQNVYEQLKAEAHEAAQPKKKAVPPTGKQRKQMISDILRLMRFTVSDANRCKLQELGESLLFEWQDLDARTVRKQIASLTE